MNEATTLGQRLKERRKELGIMAQEVAREVGICPQYMSHLEHDRAVPSQSLAFMLAFKLGVSEHWLLTGEGERCPASQSTPAAQPETISPISPTPQFAQPNAALPQTTWRYRLLAWFCARAGYRLVVPTEQEDAQPEWEKHPPKGGSAEMREVPAVKVIWGLSMKEALDGMENAIRQLREIRGED